MVKVFYLTNLIKEFHIRRIFPNFDQVETLFSLKYRFYLKRRCLFEYKLYQIFLRGLRLICLGYFAISKVFKFIISNAFYILHSLQPYFLPSKLKISKALFTKNIFHAK